MAAPDVAADRVVDGPTPKHAQLREILRRTIEQELPPGSPIPSERELAERYTVSRLTVRSAIGKLVEEGLLTRARGKGTFTAARRMELQLYLMSFTGDMRRRGLVPTTEVLERAVEVPPPPTASALGLAGGRPAYRLQRLRRADGVPLALERGWYHPGPVPGLLELDLTQSLYEQIARQYDLRFDHARQTVWAEAADRETARLLGIRAGAPLLVFRRISTTRGEPVEDITSWYRGDRYQVSMQLDPTLPAEHGGIP
ncbi:GntR family transcriptional regulator [Amycolatopsis acidiphila]|uniref:GntR family transcriptional regulator n=1 Tax=Amycolatopsis acidiphila TaxID=715473 RepID=A0A557ZUI0_9PSEU|nr:GntR family transcriptional regulator [Amycolatopsis acidiphila]TVT15674.1 GntR family transcriptional regulator [Amycolatopsis acidiphila]UIJ56742.1 GntR family transcriptional regulator [Amycolatopsis acidiphila]GHG55390.1 GntR family transcriptional regulator [Amycolatopsis acidiphila]